MLWYGTVLDTAAAGYDGSHRTNDFYEFNFKRKLWSVVLAIGSAPSPRDRHVAVVYRNSFFVFAGFDGSSRVNDFVEYNFGTVGRLEMVSWKRLVWTLTVCLMVSMYCLQPRNDGAML